ncbi:Co2+/Mg2+ efflux protein ApaG [Halopseudomonas sabulinigri]|uniref:Protein ApaG n=1 Tax=Halopseudomonas sabulinigri TaxID=472181 RepID=A0A1H1SAK6_9GAMM|nr:Co2+/Mg2+ efflux protein ApaG [Halopseudomonas sabulinigri]SDS44818.1 ApaG protein [Halopseudomonas sabulinigri]
MSNAATYAIAVSVQTRYLREQSDPAAQRFAFAYTITIANQGSLPAQLLSRHWLITDGNNKVQDVQGPGVVGEQPVIAPGASHTYTSGCLLDTPVGTMEGSYDMRASDGHAFSASIERFRLAKPNALN